MSNIQRGGSGPLITRIMVLLRPSYPVHGGVVTLLVPVFQPLWKRSTPKFLS